MLPKNWGEPTGAPAIFEKQIEIKLLHPASTLNSRIQVSKNAGALIDSAPILPYSNANKPLSSPLGPFLAIVIITILI
ncbi:MAG: hypothetical protein P8X74_22350 [Reinekea sp.]